jgi:HEAT repeat protein
MLRTALLLGVLVVPVLAHAQATASRIPPLPQDLRYVPRDGLSVTLRISPDRVQIDQVPAFTVVVRNTSRSRILLNPALTSNIRIFDSADRFVPSRHGAYADYGLRVIRANDLIPLEPGQTHEFTVIAEYHNPHDFSSVGMYSRQSIHDKTVGLSVTPGSYSVRFLYHAFLDYGPTAFPEAMPPALWEGTIETAPVPLTVLPLDGARLTQAIADVDGAAPAQTLDELSVLARSPQMVDAWLRRFQRNVTERKTVINTIRAIGDNDGISRLLDLVDALPERERQNVITDAGALLGRDAAGCRGVPWLLGSLRTHPNLLERLEDAFRVVGARCPNLITELRAIVQSPLVSPRGDGGTEAMVRANAIELLGRLRDRRDLTLLIAIARGELPAPRPSGQDLGYLRGGALRGLAWLGGEEAAQTILERLRLPGTDRISTNDAVEIAGRLPLPETTSALIDLLASKNVSLAPVVRALRLRGDRIAIPAVEDLLGSTDGGVRQMVATLLRDTGDGASLPLTRSLATDRDEWVRTMALFHVARHGNASDLPTFIGQVDTRMPQEGALEGIDRHGTAATFLPLKSKLDAVPQAARSSVSRALQRLTFAPIDGPDWDTWWTSHASTTRADWAREAIANADDARPNYLAPLALEFLSRSGSLSTQILDGALVNRNIGVRLTAARLVGESDWRRAILLLAREMEARSMSACRRAVLEFNALTARSEQVDCTNFTERASARARWTALARE